MTTTKIKKKRLMLDTDLSIANKLKRMIQLVSGIALLSATVLFICLEIYSYSQNMVRQINALANVIVANSTAAIIFDDAESVGHILSSLRDEPVITGAVIYKPDWQEFAATSMDESTKAIIINDQQWRHNVADSGVTQHRIALTYIDMLKPIYQDDELIAYLFIEGTHAPFLSYLLTDLIVISIIWVVIMFGVYVFSRNLHRRITGPINNLIKGMDEVSQEHDFSMRLPVVTEDEIGVITNSFNDMLGQVQSRDDRLEAYRNELEDKVTIRTRNLKVAMDEAIRNKDIAEQANQVKSEFLATMSHEIRTPLNGVLGMVDLITRTELSTKQKNYASAIQKSSELLLILLKNILDFSRLEAGPVELEYVDFNVNDLVNEVTNMMRISATEKGIELNVTTSPDARCIVSGDNARLTQILVNLISNAIKFTGSGYVQVSVDLQNLHDEKQSLQFIVSDTGIGIENKKQQSIFDAFVQADGSMSRKYGGSGLGLAISKKLVNAMGGEIYVDSEANIGTAFSFNIMVRIVDKPRQDDTVATNSSNEHSPHANILLAEDNAMNQEVAIDMMESMGYTADIANNGVEAVQKSQQNHFDIILMDCQMPVQDGFEATKEIRKLENMANQNKENHRHIIIAITGNALTSDKEKCIEAGMDDFLSKPYSYTQLEAILSKWSPQA